MTAVLQRRLGFWASISLVVGSVIGSSIFMKPATMAGQLPSPLWLVVVWIVAGIVSILGGMINAEVGTMLPETGGQYAYFRHMYGRFFSYLFGWASFIVINTAALAAIAFIAAQYASYFLPLPAFAESTSHSIVLRIPFVGSFYLLENLGIKMMAILMILCFTAINHRSVPLSGRIQVAFTVAKVLALLLLVGGIFLSGRGSVSHFSTNSPAMDFSSWALLSGFIAATSGALAAYDGWNNLGFAGGEIKNPQKNIPRGLIWGLLLCMLLYLLTTLAYLYILPVEEMKQSSMVATDALERVMGPNGGRMISLLVVLSTLGAINGNMMPSARVTYALARDGLFFRRAGAVHSRYHTPHNALWMQTAMACLFVLSGSFDMLADLFVLVSWIFYGFAAGGVMILRWKMPHAVRPYRLRAYPWIPLVFIFFAAFYSGMTVYNDVMNFRSGKTEIINSALGLLLVLAGVPFYFFFRARHRRASTGRVLKEQNTV